MCPDWTGPENEDTSDGEDPSADPYGPKPYGTRPYGTRPYGTRPYGTRPYGTRPYGTRPYGTRPYGTRPYGTRPYGTRPYGTRPYGTRPYGTRPYGTRPYGTREELPVGVLDPDEWSGDIAEIFCSRSAIVRLGACIVFGRDDVPIPAVEPLTGVPDYLPQPEATDPAKDKEPKLKKSAEKPAAGLSQRHLRPRKHELAVKVALPDDLVHDLAEMPEVAWGIKEDIAEALAARADRAFLEGAGDPEPLGVRGTAAAIELPAGERGGDALELARNVVRHARLAGALFRNPGWVLPPSTLAELTALVTADFQTASPAGTAGARSLDSSRLLQQDYDGGNLLDYPFVASAAARAGRTDWVYFSSDWSEAWIGVPGELITIDVSTDAHFQTDETVVRAVIRHDFVLRRPQFFVYSRTP